MGFSCSICYAAFASSEKIYSTKCGHVFHHDCLMQWLRSNPTCPQCRHRASENSIIPLYFHVNNDTTINESADCLREQADSLNFQLRLRDKSIANLTASITATKHQSTILREEVRKLESALESRNMAITGLRDQARYLKSASEEAKKYKIKVEALEKKIVELQNIDKLVNGTNDEAEEAIESMDASPAIRTYLSTLKRAMTESMNKCKIHKKMLASLKDSNQVLMVEKMSLLEKLDQAQIAVETIQQVQGTSETLKNRTDAIFKLKKKTMLADNPDEPSKRAKVESEDEENTFPFADALGMLKKQTATTSLRHKLASVITKKPRLSSNLSSQESEDIEKYAPDGHGGISRVEQFPSGSGIRKKKPLIKAKSKLKTVPNTQSIKNFVDLTSP